MRPHLTALTTGSKGRVILKDADVELWCHGLQRLFEDLLNDILECNWLLQYFRVRERFCNEVMLRRAKKNKVHIIHILGAQQTQISICEMSLRIQRGFVSTLDSCIDFDRGRHNPGSHNLTTNFILHLHSTMKTNASTSCFNFPHMLLEFNNVPATPPVWLDNGIYSKWLLQIDTDK